MSLWDCSKRWGPPKGPCRTLGDRLRTALSRSNLDDFWALIDEGGDVNEKDRNGQTMLHLVLHWEKDVSIVKAVLSAGADANALDAEGDSALHVAIVLESHPAIIKVLLAAGAEIEMPDSDGMTPLTKSINNINNYEVVRTLLLECANVNVDHLMADAVKNEADITVLRLLALARTPVNETDNGIPPIAYAVMNGDIQAVKLLITAGTKLDFRHAESRCTLLHKAYKIDIAHLLIKKGLDMDAVDIIGENPLHVAVRDDVIGVANLLIESGANVHRLVIRRKDNCMHLARSQAMVRMLASHNVDINARNVNEATPLYSLLTFCNHMATPTTRQVGSYMRSDEETDEEKLQKGIMGVKEIIRCGADVNAICTDGHSVMELAVNLGDAKVVSYMIKYGVRVDWDPLFALDMIDYDGITLLIRESMIGNVQGQDLFETYPEDADYPPQTLHWLIYARRCRAEIGRMKRTNVNCKSTVYYFIVEIGRNVKALRSCPHYELTDEDKNDLFPIYCNEIAAKFNKCYRRAGLLDLLEDIQVSAPAADGQGVVILPHYCMLAIAEFLSNKQLYNFLLAMGMQVPRSIITPKPLDCDNSPPGET